MDSLGLIGTLDVEEKAREKDTRGKGNCWSFQRQLCLEKQFPQEQEEDTA